MKKREHEEIVKRIHASYAQRLNDATRFLESDREQLLNVVNVYAKAIDALEQRILELENFCANSNNRGA